MEKSSLYTRGGDAGTTSLVGGQRTCKCAPRLEAYGTLDEFSAFLGAVSADPDCPQEYKQQILDIQNMLFNLGGYLASTVPPGEQPKAWGLTKDHIRTLEHNIDALDADTPKIHAFILPGGTPLSAKTHIARTVCRRAERHIVALSRQEYVDPELLSYINRLSDYLFILARRFNHLANVPEITWKQS